MSANEADLPKENSSEEVPLTPKIEEIPTDRQDNGDDNATNDGKDDSESSNTFGAGSSLAVDYGDESMLDSDEELRDKLSGLTESVRASLLTDNIPFTTLEYEGTVYNMFPERDTEAEQEETVRPESVIEDRTLIHTEFSVFIAAIRLFLQRKYGILPLASKEILLHFPDLDLVCGEDNMYVKKMTMDDLLSIYRVLRENSVKNGEPNVPTCLRSIVTLNPRFVSRYNDLVEVMDNNGSFAVAAGFSNDQSHPVFVEEGAADKLQLNDPRSSEVIVMDSDETSLRGSDSDIEILN